jgi:hypothetical protein
MKSLFESQTKKLTEQEKEAVFAQAMNLVINESDNLWQISNIFLIGNSLIAAIISDNLFDKTESPWGIVSIALIGLIITIIWLFSIERSRKYYLFRIAQARQREPEKWMLMNGDVEHFSEGLTVEMKGKKYNRGIGIFSNIVLVRAVVIVFIVFFVGVISYKLFS